MQKRKPVPEISDEEEARIQAGIALDPDNSEWTEEDFHNAKPFAEMFPDIAKSLEDGDAVVVGDPRLNKLVSLDRHVVEKFESQGGNWRERINDILRKAVGL
jgi:uncharacterized protein (DUF4415 family)